MYYSLIIQTNTNHKMCNTNENYFGKIHCSKIHHILRKQAPGLESLHEIANIAYDNIFLMDGFHSENRLFKRITARRLQSSMVFGATLWKSA
jgi:hypothetical protein